MDEKNKQNNDFSLTLNKTVFLLKPQFFSNTFEKYTKLKNSFFTILI